MTFLCMLLVSSALVIGPEYLTVDMVQEREFVVYDRIAGKDIRVHFEAAGANLREVAMFELTLRLAARSSSHEEVFAVSAAMRKLADDLRLPGRGKPDFQVELSPVLYV